jgi:kinesin family member C1
METNATSVDNEPEPKQRKTLVERAGESRSIAAATPSARPVVKGTSLVGAGVSSFFFLPHQP